MHIVNFNVLARQGPELGARIPDPEGRSLWNMFHAQTMGDLAIVVDENLNKGIFEQWLLREGIKAQFYEFLDSSDPVVKADKVHILKAAYGRIGWYIDNDPRTIALTLSKGIPSLLVGSPFTIRPEWENERSITPWDELVAEMDSQKMKQQAKVWSYLEDEVA
jgi:hypothetical protein